MEKAELPFCKIKHINTCALFKCIKYLGQTQRRGCFGGERIGPLGNIGAKRDLLSIL